MPVNKVSFTINSRQYTVVAEESVEYIERLCSHINEKVERVIKGGQNVLGERPIVLAALNICDEYYKAVDAGELIREQTQRNTEKNLKLQQTVRDLQKELDTIKSGQISIDEAALKAEISSAQSELSDANSKIKFLEGHIKSLEDKIKTLEGRYNNQGNKPSFKNGEKR
jgi:cell division protein ZapA (FtsZ GTPase activity inhibitor)